jgi:hypothetical protein
MVGTLAPAEDVARLCCLLGLLGLLGLVGLLGAAGEEGGTVGALCVDCCVVAAGPAWKPRLDVAGPLPGETSTNAAAMIPARASGPNPKSKTLTSVLRRLRETGRPTEAGDFGGLARCADLKRLKLPIPRRAGVTGAAKGPTVGTPAGPLGYQPTVDSSSESGSGGSGGRCGPESGGNATAPVTAAVLGGTAAVLGGTAGGRDIGIGGGPARGPLREVRRGRFGLAGVLRSGGSSQGLGRRGRRRTRWRGRGRRG